MLNPPPPPMPVPADAVRRRSTEGVLGYDSDSPSPRGGDGRLGFVEAEVAVSATRLRACSVPHAYELGRQRTEPSSGYPRPFPAPLR